VHRRHDDTLEDVDRDRRGGAAQPDDLGDRLEQAAVLGLLGHRQVLLGLGQRLDHLLHDHLVLRPEPRPGLADGGDEVADRRLGPQRRERGEVHRHPLPERDGVEADVVLRHEAVDRLVAALDPLLLVLRTDALDLGDHLAGRARAHADQLLGEHERRDLEQAPWRSRCARCAGPRPGAASCRRGGGGWSRRSTRRTENHTAQCASILEVELLLVADLTEQPGVELDELERLRQRAGALVALDLGDVGSTVSPSGSISSSSRTSHSPRARDAKRYAPSRSSVIAFSKRSLASASAAASCCWLSVGFLPPAPAGLG
jgi:hypothetical protein